MGVALTSCIIPASGKPIFQIGTMKWSWGWASMENPVWNAAGFDPASEVAEFLVSRILADLKIASGDEVAVLVNGLGSTPMGELLIIFRSVHRLLEDAGISIFRTYVGNYSASLDMAGCSVSLMHLDSDLKRWLMAPCEGPGLVQV